MKTTISWAVCGLALIAGPASADNAMPLASHRAAYEITLAGTDTHRPGGEEPVGATGLIAYEFRGSACEGYASNFRQLTQLQRNEGAPISSDIRAVSFEDGDAKSLRFEIESQNSGADQPPVSGSAARGVNGDLDVDLKKPDQEKIDLGKDVLFPTQHIERIIAEAKRGAETLEARVFDGSDTGKKVFATLTVIGKEATGPNPDATVAEGLAKLRRWPVSVSYFDEKAKDAPPEYVLSFDLYENGVSGTLKLDYGTFTLSAKLAKLEWLPSPACGK